MHPAKFFTDVKYPNRFKPGVSGNYAGRPKTNQTALKAAAFARTITEPVAMALFDAV